MGWLDLLLKRSVIIGSVLVVLVLSGVALYSAINATKAEQTPESSDDIPAPAGRAVPGPRLQVDDGLFPLSVGCIPSEDVDGRYVIAIQNQGTVDAAYLVAATLVTEAGATQEVIVAIPPLLPGQEVEQPITETNQLGNIDSCSVTAVESNRRVLLFEQIS